MGHLNKKGALGKAEGTGREFGTKNLLKLSKCGRVKKTSLLGGGDLWNGE